MDPNTFDCPTLVDCGCVARVYADGSGVDIDYCSTHYAASDLLAALKELLSIETESAGLTADIVRNKGDFAHFMRLNDAKIKSACEKAKAAVEKAEGK